MPCSGSKSSGGKTSLEGRILKKELSPEEKERLERLRENVADSFDISFHDNKELKQAYRRYTGNIYNKIPENAWERLKKRENIELVIISALYGTIYWDEAIMNYNVAMDDNIKPRRRLNTWWKKAGLSDIVSSYIDMNGFETVRSFLSGDYKDAIPSIENKIEATWLQYDYSGLGSGSNYYRGDDITNVLLDRKIECPECKSRKTKRVSKESYECDDCGNEYWV